jgi:2-polyprenyl-6-methoxyphenol hydroxylase-like FAD-dependent oxidoreductase
VVVKDDPILIAGGGLGGVAAALALGRKGFRVRVLEQAPEFGVIGYGIQLGPNVFSMFDRLGITDAVLAQSITPKALLMIDSVDAGIIARIPTDASFRERFKRPYVVIHRVDLHRVLLDACKELDNIELLPLAGVAAFEDLGGRVRVTTEDGRAIEGVALIGADGLHSTVRTRMFNEGGPRMIGYVAHRTIAPMADVSAEVRHVATRSGWQRLSGVRGDPTGWGDAFRCEQTQPARHRQHDQRGCAAGARRCLSGILCQHAQRLEIRIETMPGPIVPLDKRIADCLAASTHELADLRALVDETVSTIGSVEAELTHASARALDPTVHDPDARRHAEDAKFMLARLNAARPRLQKLHDDAVAAKERAKWNTKLEHVKKTRDEMADKFREKYCELVAGLIGLFQEVEATDKWIDEFNTQAVSDVSRVRHVEATARGIEDFAQSKSVLKETKLPAFVLGSGQVPPVWPKVGAPLSLQIMGAMIQPAPSPMDDELQAAFEQGGNAEYCRVLERRRQTEAERWAEQGREKERQREAAAAEEAQRWREAAVERRRQGM